MKSIQNTFAPLVMTRAFLYAAAASVAMAGESVAADMILSKELAVCAAIDGDLTRLECYDKLASDNGLDSPQTVPANVEGKGKWNVSITTNPINDTKTVTLSLRADSGLSAWGNSISLAARCLNNVTDFYIIWGDYIADDHQRVTHRVGDLPAATERWIVSTDNEATFYPKPIQLLKEMLNKGKYAAQTTPYNESPVTAIFDTDGLVNAIKPLRDTCGW